jgi:TraX protein
MNKYKMLSSSSLKLFAIILMTIDHIAVILHPYISNDFYLLMRIFGRMAFPIFAFLIVEGFHYTRNINKYLVRLGIFALISEIPFDLAIYNKIIEPIHQNVFFTLFLGLLSIDIFKRYQQRNNISLGLLFVLLIGLLADLLNTDYGLFGIAMIFSFYYFRNHFISILLSISIINFLMTGLKFDSIGSMLQAFAISSLVFIYTYNGQKGLKLKYIFYLFYPLHLLVLFFINVFVL